MKKNRLLLGSKHLKLINLNKLFFILFLMAPLTLWSKEPFSPKDVKVTPLVLPKNVLWNVVPKVSNADTRGDNFWQQGRVLYDKVIARDRFDQLIALDLYTGKVLWQKQMSKNRYYSGSYFVVDKNEDIFYATDTYLYRVDSKTGKNIWAYTIGESKLSPWTLTDNKNEIWIITSAELQCIDKKTGTLLSSHILSYTPKTRFTYSDRYGAYFLGFNNKQITSYDLDLNPLWSSNLGKDITIRQQSTLDNLLLVPTDIALFLLSLDSGSIQSRYDQYKNEVFFVLDNHIYSKNLSTHSITAYTNAIKFVWRFQIDNPSFAGGIYSTAFLVDPLIVFTSYTEGILYILNKDTGKEVRRYNLKNLRDLTPSTVLDTSDGFVLWGGKKSLTLLNLSTIVERIKGEIGNKPKIDLL